MPIGSELSWLSYRLDDELLFDMQSRVGLLHHCFADADEKRDCTQQSFCKSVTQSEGAEE